MGLHVFLGACFAGMGWHCIGMREESMPQRQHVCFGGRWHGLGCTSSSVRALLAWTVCSADGLSWLQCACLRTCLMSLHAPIGACLHRLLAAAASVHACVCVLVYVRQLLPCHLVLVSIACNGHPVQWSHLAGCYFNLFRLMAKCGVLENLLLKEHTHTFCNTVRRCGVCRRAVRAVVVLYMPCCAASLPRAGLL